MNKLTAILEDFRKHCIAWDSSRGIKLAEAEAAINQYISEIIGEDIIWEWKPFNETEDVTDIGLDPKDYTFEVCTACGAHRYDPESVHLCEQDNALRAEQRARAGLTAKGDV